VIGYDNEEDGFTAFWGDYWACAGGFGAVWQPVLFGLLHGLIPS